MKTFTKIVYKNTYGCKTMYVKDPEKVKMYRMLDSHKPMASIASWEFTEVVIP